VDHVFRLISTRRSPEWVILENVSYMLRLQQGRAMTHILERLEDLGFNWAYRVIDARSVGLAQRRERVVLIASRKHNPEEFLFPNGYISPPIDDRVGPVNMKSLYGFYWTEGKRGLGWTKDAVPTIKAGSSLGIASPPAIWNPRQDFFGTPDIRDAERLFGFPEDWTKPSEVSSTRRGARWRLVGNTICVPMVSWIGKQLKSPKGFRAVATQMAMSGRPPLAGYGNRKGRYSVNVSSWCTDSTAPRLATFLTKPLKPLSERATEGFYSRANESTTLRFADGFLGSIEKYLAAEAA
jgi:DNA (cytosine-5)-methyltransferase 1